MKLFALVVLGLVGCAAATDAEPGVFRPLPLSEQRGGATRSTVHEPGDLFLEAWTIVRDNFFDPTFNGVDWNGVRDEILPAAQRAANAPELASVINSALARLRVSHTFYYTQHDRAYYELLDIFNPPPEGVPANLAPTIAQGPVTYVGVGVITQRIGDRFFAADVYPGGPADAAGVHIGDEILGVEDDPWSDIDAFREREGVATRLRVRRALSEEAREIVVTPSRIQPYQLFLDSIDRGARLIDHDGRSVAYIRVRSYASSSFHEKVVELLRTRLSSADALVLDLRGPWGGASPEYLSLFNPLTPVFQSKTRTGEWTTPMMSWRRPAALIVDSGVRSGKELLAFAFREHNIGPVVGTKTAGAVLGGRPFILSDGSILYLAVQDVQVGGKRLEGVGVEPSVRVERSLPFADGRDPVIEAALEAVIGR